MMVWDAAMINIGAIVEVLAIDMLADEDTVIFLKFVIITSFSVDVSSDVSVNFFVNVLTDVILDILPDISIEVLTDVNINAFAVVMTALEFRVSTPPEELNR